MKPRLPTASTVTVTAAAKSGGANAQSVDPNAPGNYIVPVTINVTDVNEPPTITAPTVAAHATEPKYKLEVSWTAPTMTGKPAVSDYDVHVQERAAIPLGQTTASPERVPARR